MDVIGLLIGAVGILLSLYAYFKTRRIKRLSYAVRTFPLVSADMSRVQNLEITYRKEPITSLTAARILIKNTGTEVIRSADFAAADPLRIALRDSNATLLAGRPTFMTEAANDVRFAPDGSSHEAFVNVDYLAPGQSAVLAFLHTASDGKGVQPIGTLIGGGIVHHRPPAWLVRVRKVTKWIPVLATGVITLLWTSQLDLRDPKSPWLVVVVVAPIFVGTLVEMISGSIYGSPAELEQQFKPEDV